MKRSKDYHDYVFRDGKLVGEFEEMYQLSENVPWRQDEQADWVDVRLTTEMLRDVGPFDELHDLGCGLGYYLSLMSRQLGTKDCRSVGYDVSPTACQKAASLFPRAEFLPLDLTVGTEGRPRVGGGLRRLFMIRGTLWYVFPKLGRVIETIGSLMAEDDTLLVVQNFPPLHSTFVGKEVIPDHRALVQHFSQQFEVKRSLWYEDTLKTANDNWFIGIFSPRRQS